MNTCEKCLSLIAVTWLILLPSVVNIQQEVQIKNLTELVEKYHLEQKK